MPELESKQTLSRSEIADYLREFADELDTSAQVDEIPDAGETGRTERSDDAGGTDDPDDATADATDERATTAADRVTIIVGDRSATVNPPETATFEIEVESDSSLVGSGEEQSVSFEIEWEVEEVDDESQIEIT